MVSWRLIVACLAGCGRISFDPLASAGDGGPGDATPSDATQGDATMPAGAIAWWPLDEGTGTVAADAIGTLDGVLAQFSAAVPPSWTPGHSGTAVLFGGDGDQIQISSAPAINNLPQLSVSAWIRPTSVAVPLAHCIFDHGDPGIGWAFTIAEAADGDLAFHVNYSASLETRTSVTGTLQINVWTHVVVTWTGQPAATSIRLYKDGAEVSYATAIDGSGSRVDDSPLGIQLNCNATSGYAGAIDDVMIFDRVLTPGEVAAF